MRQALGVLAEEGLIQPRRGSGTFVQAPQRLVHRVGLHTRLTASLGEQAQTTSELLYSGTEAATLRTAEALGVEPGDPVLRVELLRLAHGAPIVRSSRWLRGEELPDFTDHLRREATTTAALHACGVHDYVRARTTVTARPATMEETHELQLQVGAVVLVMQLVDAYPDGRPLQVGFSRFAADRVELAIDTLPGTGPT